MTLLNFFQFTVHTMQCLLKYTMAMQSSIYTYSKIEFPERQPFTIIIFYYTKSSTTLLMSPLANTLHLQLTPMPLKTSTLTTITKSCSIIKNSSDNPIFYAPSSSGTIYHRTSKPPIPYRSSSTIYTLITKPNCLPTYHHR